VALLEQRWCACIVKIFGSDVFHYSKFRLFSSELIPLHRFVVLVVLISCATFTSQTLVSLTLMKPHLESSNWKGTATHVFRVWICFFPATAHRFVPPHCQCYPSIAAQPELLWYFSNGTLCPPSSGILMITHLTVPAHQIVPCAFLTCPEIAGSWPANYAKRCGCWVFCLA